MKQQYREWKQYYYKAERESWRGKEVFGTRRGWIIRHVHAHGKNESSWGGNGKWVVLIRTKHGGGDEGVQKERERDVGAA